MNDWIWQVPLTIVVSAATAALTVLNPWLRKRLERWLARRNAPAIVSRVRETPSSGVNWRVKNRGKRWMIDAQIDLMRDGGIYNMYPIGSLAPGAVRECVLQDVTDDTRIWLHWHSTSRRKVGEWEGSPFEIVPGVDQYAVHIRRDEDYPDIAPLE